MFHSILATFQCALQEINGIYPFRIKNSLEIAVQLADFTDIVAIMPEPPIESQQVKEIRDARIDAAFLNERPEWYAEIDGGNLRLYAYRHHTSA